MNTTTSSSYIIKISSAKMPGTCKGTYRRIAVLRVDPGVTSVSAISPRARGVREIVQTWERLSVGTTPRCAYAVALAEAEAMVASLTGASTVI